MAGRSPDIQVSVSWNWSEEHQFGGDEDILDRRLISDTLTIQYGRDVARPLGEPLVPVAGWSALNNDRLLSPEWPGTTLYQLLRPGKPTRVRAFLGDAVAYDDAVDYDADIDYDEGEGPFDLHSGVLDVPDWTTDLGSPSVSMKSVGLLARLSRKINWSLESNVRVDQCITFVLNQVIWPAELRDLGLADTTLDWFWVDNETALEVLIRLQHTEGVPALIWEGPDGVIHFEPRNYRTNTTRSNTPQAVFVDQVATVTAITPRLYHSGIGYQQPYSDVYNQVTCPITHRERQALQKVWEFGGPLVLGANEARVITAQLSDPADGFVAMALGTDYTVSAGALTLAPAYTETYAQSIKVRFVADSGGATVIGVTSDGPQIRATPVTVITEDVIEQTVDTQASIDTYDPITHQPSLLELQAYPEIAAATAEALCDAAALYYMDVRPIVTVRVLNQDEDHLRAQIDRRPSDRVAVVSQPLGLDGDVHVEQVSYRLVPEGLELILSCERALSQLGAAVWDDPGALWDDPGTLWGL